MNPNFDPDALRLQRVIEKRRRKLARARWWDTVAYCLGKIMGSIAWIVL